MCRVAYYTCKRYEMRLLLLMPSLHLACDDLTAPVQCINSKSPAIFRKCNLSIPRDIPCIKIVTNDEWAYSFGRFRVFEGNDFRN